MFNLATSYYTLDIYKYLSLVFENQDLIISILFFCSTFIYVFSNFFTTFVWNSFGFDITMIILHFCNILNLILICTSKDYFLFEVFFARFGLGYVLIF